MCIPEIDAVSKFKKADADIIKFVFIPSALQAIPNIYSLTKPQILFIKKTTSNLS